MARPDRLRVALAHLAPDRTRPHDNRAALVAAVAAAARQGAHLVLAPELAVAGYGFRSDAEVAAVAEPRHGPTLAALTKACADAGVWCAAGYLERDDATGQHFNSAVLVGPEGLAGHHRKLVAESRWATCGDPSQARPIATPWGPVGLLICADTYYSGPARALARRGAGALIVLANWPRGELDPRRIWRARAAENGVPVLVANRTGVDGQFDARSGASAMYDGTGATLLEYESDQPGVVVGDVPLAGGVWAARPEALTGPVPARHVLPDGPPPLHPFSGRERQGLTTTQVDHSSTHATMVRLVPVAASSVAHPLCDGVDLVVAAPGVDIPHDLAPVVIGRDAVSVVAHVGGVPSRPGPGEGAVLARAGALLVAAVELCDALHPETTLALADRGVDLIVVAADSARPGEVDRVLLRCLDRTAVAVVLPGRAHLAVPPRDHGAPEMTSTGAPIDVSLHGRWSSRTGGAWEALGALDREALC